MPVNGGGCRLGGTIARRNDARREIAQDGRVERACGPRTRNALAPRDSMTEHRGGLARPSRRSRMNARFALPLVASLVCALTPAPDAYAQNFEPDPVPGIVERLNRYFHAHEADGVCLDSRYDLAPTEVIRLSVVSQLLGYEELYRVTPDPELARDIRERADYLLAHFDEIRSFTSFDGMLGYALLEAYDVTRDPRHFDHGRIVAQQLRSLPYGESILNGGLMSALALAKYHRLTGDPSYEAKTREIIGSEIGFQNADGSFPHWCPGSEDIHYTAWMTQEFILLDRLLPDPRIGPMVAGMLAFLESRTDDRGVSLYEAPCDEYPGCVRYYWSVASGCGIDYDTRAFTNEVGYTALLFGRFASPAYPRVARFLASLERGGAFADKWDFLPPPSDPYYPWTIADTSVVNMSVLFWSLAALVALRDDPLALDVHDREPGANDPPAARGPERTPGPLPPAREPSGGGDGPPKLAAIPLADGRVALRFVTAAPGRVRLVVHDAAGRRLGVAFDGDLPAGRHETAWDGRDRGGRPLPAGVYFARAEVPAGLPPVRFALVGR